MAHPFPLLTQAAYLKSAPNLKLCPPESGREVAFVGRSNAGKSSALNCIANRADLARTSKTPGRTQMLNFFRLTDELRLVDLPGYGYAKVPEKMKDEWQKHLGEYLEKRQCLVGIMLVMDIRHPFTEFDAMMVEWAIHYRKPLHILLTKCDKLNRGPAKNTLLEVKREVADYADLISVQQFSALKKIGIEEAQLKLKQWLIDDAENTEN
ncbi:MAG TPA: ribosome biogenesis GTP-binding protein YihA/YsxC [Pseudomonadales bacterium]|nr:ribosome biogenesis GTP-binding protein YihA/YsxC [Pseudomonadales bacterium]